MAGFSFNRNLIFGSRLSWHERFIFGSRQKPFTQNVTPSKKQQVKNTTESIREFWLKKLKKA